VNVVVYGSRPDGHAKVVVDLAADDSQLVIIGLVDDFPENAQRKLRGLSVLGLGSELAELRDRHGLEGVVLGFGESRGRIEVAERALGSGYELPQLVHRSSLLSRSARVADGAQVLAGTYIGPDARLGLAVLVNTGAIVEHDVKLAEGAVVGPGATLCGRVEVGPEATIGASATLLPDVKIGTRAVVGAGALVREDVADEALVAGVPAKPLPRA
jgi:sugar O-acyltransferase (sialic acid O-acetyltransferase NeuD family)